MELQEVLKELESYGSDQTKKTYIKHGAKEPLFGVKVQDLKKIVKKIKKDHSLSLELFATLNADAMYMAGLIADESKISKKELQQWASQAYFYWNCEYTVPWVAAESNYGIELGLDWINSKKETIASTGWATLSNCASILPDFDLDLKIYTDLLDRVEKTIHQEPNRVRYTMNGFVIATACYIVSLTEKARKVAESIGVVAVDMGGTSCKVPLATTTIQKVIDRGSLGKKRKQARC